MRGKRGKKRGAGPQARRSGGRIRSEEVGRGLGAGQELGRSLQDPSPRAGRGRGRGRNTRTGSYRSKETIFTRTRKTVKLRCWRGKRERNRARAVTPSPGPAPDPRGGCLLLPGSHSQHARLCLRLLPAADSSPAPAVPRPSSPLHLQPSPRDCPRHQCLSAAVPCSPWGRPSTGTETVRLSSLLRLDSLLRSRISRGCI